MDVVEVSEHSHPLKLVDLQLQYEDEEDEEEKVEGGDPIMKEGCRVACERCGEEINMYHRYYYKCIMAMEGSLSCDDFSLHKFCAELPERLEHPSHPNHTLGLRPHKPGESFYKCYIHDFSIDVKCAVQIGKNVIHHPCHPHLLTCVIPKPILCECSACGRRHEGIFYQCTTSCNGFTIHSECVFQPKSLLIQQTTDDDFHHTHPVTISYSFPLIDQTFKYFPKCRVCDRPFYDTRDMENLWIYKCYKCMYYVHLDCATSRREPFMSIFLSAGLGRTIKIYEDIDHPGLVHLPFPDESYSLPKHLFFQQIDQQHHIVDYLKHMSHKHPLILVDQTQSNSSKIKDSLLLMCHNPMKKTQLLCNGCLKPIMATMPFYQIASLFSMSGALDYPQK
ncbi:unnamed protein product [Lactuca virosa]|uniref:DC1 domain-containing protein n=1 Tax=Lactuca virosa TaxID=75947 RepID=A0AAU9PLD7_9ASTR|nr:unnamed protein product [Lactuca virosa]